MTRQLLAAPMAALLALASPLASSCATSDPGQAAHAKSYAVQTEEVVYEADGVRLTGFLARPASVEGSAPGVLVVHEWWGHNDYVRRRAAELAELGYVAFALDMYGDGKLAEHPEDATAFMQEVMGNAEAMESRFLAALDVLNSQEDVDAEKTGAIGYCMGGGIVLRMARSTDRIDAVASFHGSLGAALGAGDAGGLTHVLISNGADDTFVPAEALSGLEAEMKALSDVQSVTVLNHEGAIHGFTNPAATAKGKEFDIPLAYNAAADAASWAALKTMFASAL